MICIGIDIAKLNHFAAAVSSDGEILIEPFKFTNDYDGFYLLLSKLAPLDQNSIIIGLESTAHRTASFILKQFCRKSFRLYSNLNDILFVGCKIKSAGFANRI